MNLIKYSQKLPVYVSAGVFIAGSIWFARMDWSALGEDVAELRSAVEERKLAMKVDYKMIYGWEEDYPGGPLILWPNDIKWTPVQTWFGTNQVWVEVIEDTSGGGVTVSNGLANTPLVFTDANYSDNQTVYFNVATNARAGSYVEAAVYVDGVMQTGRMIAVVGKAPPGGESGSASIGGVTLGWTRKRFEKSTAYEQTIRLDAAPREMESQIIISEHTSKTQFYSNVMYAAKIAATSGTGGELPYWQYYDYHDSAPVPLWLTGDINDGDVLSEMVTGTWYDANTIHYITNTYGVRTYANYFYLRDLSYIRPPVRDVIETTATRNAGEGVTFAAGIGRTNAPLSTTLYHGWSTSPWAREVLDGLGYFWADIGNGSNYYDYASESNGVSLTDAIAINDLDQTSNVLTNLNRTLVFLPVSALTSNVSYTVVDMRFETNRNWVSSSPASRVPQLWDEALDSALARVTSSNTYDVYDGGLAAYRHEAESEPYPYRSGQGTVTNREYLLCWLTLAKVTGKLYGYPSHDAVAAGIVKRVRVFAVTRNRNVYMHRGYAGQEIVPDLTVTGATVTGDFRAVLIAMTKGIVKGLTNGPNSASNLVLPLEEPDLLNSCRYRDTEDDYPPQFVARLVTEVEDPTETGIDIDIGCVDDFDDPDCYTWTTTQYTSSRGYIYNHDQRSASIRTGLHCWAVVVDWEFSHLGETAYEPTPYTPEWLSTNTP